MSSARRKGSVPFGAGKISYSKISFASMSVLYVYIPHFLNVL
jgi:hypothetical protein